MKNTFVLKELITRVFKITCFSLWKTYTLLVVISVLSGLLLLNSKWANEIKNTFNNLAYANELLYESMNNDLHQKTSLLKILGSRLLEQDSLMDSPESDQLINEFLLENPGVIGFGLATPDGRLITTTHNIDPGEAPNLFTHPKTRESFRRALDENSLVLGNTYYFSSLNRWIIPLRHRIKDANNQVVAVMTAGIDVTGQAPWGGNKLPRDIKLMLVRNDGYFQYISDADVNIRPSVYETRFDSNILRKIKNKLINKSSASDSLLRLQIGDFGDNARLITVSYNNDFEHFIITEASLQIIINKWLPTAVGLISLLIIFNSTLYFLFRKSEQLNNNANQKIRHQANHDQLTKLPNRYTLETEFIHWRQRYQNKFSLLFVDLDNFKAVNDLHGHAVGDIILKKVAKRITKAFIDCLCFRHGGDEFIVLSPIINKDLLLIQCRKFNQKLKKPFVVDELEFNINASIGISIAPFHGLSLVDLLRKSDMAMYHAKKASYFVNIFSHQMEVEAKRKSILEKELSHAINNHELSLVYQPQYCATTNELKGMETLIRWHSEVLGNVAPEEFIPVAESSGLINQLGEYVLMTAIHESNEICAMLEPEVHNSGIRHNKKKLSINVSIQQLMRDNFLSMVKQAIEHQVCPQMQLMFEVTENLFINDLQKAKNVLRQLQLMGVHISLDDFGTGYSSLSVLNHLPLNELKIDKSFIFAISSNEQTRNLVQSIIDIGHNLFIPVVAEGVEYKEQAIILTQMGCDTFQGFHFSRPLSKAELIKSMQRPGSVKPGNNSRLYLIESN